MLIDPSAPPSTDALLSAPDRPDAGGSTALDGFADVIRLARRLCAAPTALVSMAAPAGQTDATPVDGSSGRTELGRLAGELALAEPDLLVVPDLAADPRPAAARLMRHGSGVRFYAGAPLRGADGRVLGCLCVLDETPRPDGLTPEQLDDLRALARQAAARLDAGSVLRNRREEDNRQRETLVEARRFGLVGEASAALFAADDPAAVLQPILARGADALGFDRAMIYDAAAGGRHLRLTQTVGLSPDECRDLDRDLRGLPLAGTLSGMVAETRRSLVRFDLQPDSEPVLEARSGVRAYAGYPLLSGGELSGVISFASTSRPAFGAGALSCFESLAGLLSATIERLDREGDLAEVGAYWRSLFERLAEGFVVGEVLRDAAGRVVDWRYLEVNNAWGDLVGIEPRSVLGRTVRDVIPGVEDEWIDEVARVIDTREPASFLRRVAVLDRWYEGRVFAIASERFGITLLEVTDRVKAEARLGAQLAIGDRLRDLTSIPEMTRAVSGIVGETLGAIRVAFGQVDAVGEFVEIAADWTASGGSGGAGRHRVDAYGDLWSDLQRGEPLVLDDPDGQAVGGSRLPGRSRNGACIHVPVRDRGRVVAVLIVHHARAQTWTTEVLEFLRSVADRLEAAVARSRAEEQQRLLNGEVSHRLKNSLAMVQSIARQTLRGVSERGAVEGFQQRLMAMAKAQDLLLEGGWSGASIRTVVTGVLELHAPAAQFALRGEDLRLTPQAAISLSLLLHELATNAVKYGALSTETGQVTLTWRIDEDQDPVLQVDWVEDGGPPAEAPARHGFGSRLIQSGLDGSRDVLLDYASPGLRARFRAPASQVLPT